MLDEFPVVFDAIGWTNFWDIQEEGSVLLTKEFLSTLRVQESRAGTNIYFHFFNQEYNLSLRELSTHLGFASNCTLVNDPPGFDAPDFWKDISAEITKGKHSITRIHNPTLRFLARWTTKVVFPRDDTRCVLNCDLKILYAMCRRYRYAPVVDMVYYWLRLVNDNNDITITSLVTRIAREVGALDNARVTYIPNDLSHLVTDQHFF